MYWSLILHFSIYVRTSRIMSWRMCRDGWCIRTMSMHAPTVDQFGNKTFITPAMRWCLAWNRGRPGTCLYRWFITHTLPPSASWGFQPHHHQFSLPHMVKTTQPLKRHQASFIKPHGLLSLAKNLFVGHVPIYESSKTAKKRRASLV